MESVRSFSPVTTRRQQATLEFINRSFVRIKSDEFKSEFPLPKTEESENQEETIQNCNISTESKAENASKVTFGLTTPEIPSFAQIVKGNDQLENTPRVRFNQTWSEVSASKTAMTPSQSTIASDQRPASSLKPEDGEKHPILKLLQKDKATERNRGDQNTRTVVMISELDFQIMLSSKDDTISALQQENARLLENTKSLTAKLSKSESDHQQANEKVKQLESELNNERKKVQEAQISMEQLTREVGAAPAHQGEDDEEKRALRDQVINLKYIIEKQQTEHEDVLQSLYDGQIKTDKGRRDAIRRADQLKASLIAEKVKAQESEICLARQMEETSKLQAALVKMERDLEEQRLQWEQEKVALLTNNQETSEVEQLKYQLQSQTAMHEDDLAALYNELLKRNRGRIDAIRMADQLKEKLREEQNKTKEAENCLAKQKEETSNLKAALVQMERALEDQQRQWEAEKSPLLTIQQERDEMEQLIKQMELEKAEAESEMAALHLELQNKNQCHQDAARKVIELNISLVAEKTRAKEAEVCLAKQVQEACKTKAALVKVEQDVDNQRLLWAQEKNSLLKEHQKTVGKVEAARKDILDVLNNERQEWQTEKSYLLEIIETTKESLTEMEVEKNTSAESLTDKLKLLQQELSNFQERKPKNKSFKKRFRSVFKGFKKAQPQSENGVLTSKTPNCKSP